MTDFAKMDVFFLVTTIAVVVVAALVVFVLYRVWRILGEVEKISKIVGDEGTLLRADIADLRSNIRHEGFKLKHAASFGRAIAGRFTGRKRGSE